MYHKGTTSFDQFKCTFKNSAVAVAASNCAAYLANPCVSSGKTFEITLFRPKERIALINPTDSENATSHKMRP